MKTLIVAISLSLFSMGAFAQKKTAATDTKKVPAKTAQKVAVSYRCPVCGATADKAGNCTKDKDVAMVKVGDYYCPDCYMTSTKPGKCTMCNVEMKKMEATSAKK
jgi:hypothetical protein